MDAEAVRSALPPSERGAFDDIVGYRILGASNHIGMIGKMFGGIAKECAQNGESAQEMLKRISLVGNYFIETRGKASSAVANAIMDMTSGQDEYRERDIADASRSVLDRLERFRVGMQEAQEKLVSYISNVMGGMRAIMAFDYSSTISRFLAKGFPGTVFIPESRTINGGRNFVETCVKSGCATHFIPDAAILYYLRECDAAIIGVETFYPDGTVFNTTGSDILGMACVQLNIPLYAATTLNKLDWRGAYGNVKEPVMQDLREVMRTQLEGIDVSGVDFVSPELLPIPPGHIAAYITEQGIIPASQMYGVSRSIAEARSGKGMKT